jgi:hypothetical protein
VLEKWKCLGEREKILMGQKQLQRWHLVKMVETGRFQRDKLSGLFGRGFLFAFAFALKAFIPFLPSLIDPSNADFEICSNWEMISEHWYPSFKLLSKVTRRTSLLYLGSCPLPFSSTVKTAPHFGHFTCWGGVTILAQPKKNAARTNNTTTRLMHFFTPLHLFSLL